jgi:copper oxidase (laccase) domain-containing protein
MVSGPCIGPASFEVSREFQLGFAAPTWSLTGWGTLSVDLIEAVAEQMSELGLPADSWTPSGIDTFTQLDWHSHRRTGTSARNATLCWIPSATARTRTIHNLLLP